jgi:DNA-binding winged helix-turn-helix (wHTH) protein/Tfp pilus assembly protein PilF
MEPRIRFAEFELDPDNHVLTRDGVIVKLAPQPFKVLLLLVQRPDTLVTRETLRQAIWGAETAVDFEHGLNTCIRQIRLALGDNADAPRFIETVPRLGYRFRGAVAPAPLETPARQRRLPAALRAAVLAAIVFMTGGGVHLLMTASPSSAHREADDLYLRGRLALEDRTGGNARAALALFQKALEVSERYAPAHAGIADVYLQKPTSIPGVPPSEAIARAQRAIERALALDERLPEAHLSAAQLWMTLRDWPRAGREYERALALAPRHAGARQDYALWLSYQERFDEALNEARLGESLDPLSVRGRSTVAEVLRHARRFDAAITQAQHALELNPNYGRAHTVLGHCYLAQGRLEAAIQEHERSSHGLGNVGFAYALAGQVAKARSILAQMHERYERTRGGAGEIAQVHVGLREYEQAFEWLARAVEDGAVWTLRVAVVWDALRSDPRFERLVQRAFDGR